jgi:hypothetical protein
LAENRFLTGLTGLTGLKGGFVLVLENGRKIEDEDEDEDAEAAQRAGQWAGHRTWLGSSVASATPRLNEDSYGEATLQQPEILLIPLILSKTCPKERLQSPASRSMLIERHLQGASFFAPDVK